METVRSGIGWGCGWWCARSLVELEQQVWWGADDGSARYQCSALLFVGPNFFAKSFVAFGGGS